MNEMKKSYQSPSIDKVELDNEISLILASGDSPWGDPISDAHQEQASDSHLA